RLSGRWRRRTERVPLFSEGLGGRLDEQAMTVGRPGLPCRQKDLEAEAPQPLDGRTVERQGTAAGTQQLDPKALGRLDVQHRRQGDNGLHQNSSQPSSEAAGSSLRAAPPWPTVFMAVTVRLAG